MLRRFGIKTPVKRVDDRTERTYEVAALRDLCARYLRTICNTDTGATGKTE